MTSKTIIIQSETLGRGDDDLGMLLMSNLLRLLAESPEKPAKMIFTNTAVNLACEGSWALAHLKKLEEQGMEILACRTCLDYLEITDKLAAGKLTTMDKTIESMLTTDTVCL